VVGKIECKRQKHSNLFSLGTNWYLGKSRTIIIKESSFVELVQRVEGELFEFELVVNYS